MIPKIIQCKYCGAEVEVKTYRKYVVCPYCKERFDFEGFEYIEIEAGSSMLAHVKYEQDCPACRSRHMFLGPSGRLWKCVDCGYRISAIKKFFGVFWFCDGCDTYMNVQKGFTTKRGKWKCTECGFENSVTKKDIW